MQVDPELAAQAKAEAEAIVAEAHEQAKRLQQAADDRRKDSESNNEEIRRVGRQLAGDIEKSIDELTKILEELKKQLG